MPQKRDVESGEGESAIKMRVRAAEIHIAFLASIKQKRIDPATPGM